MIKIVYTPKSGAADNKKLYTTLKYQAAQLMVNGKTKKATTGLVSLYTNKFGSNGKAISEYAYTYDAWGNITDIKDLAGNKRSYAYNDFGEIAAANETIIKKQVN